MWIPNEYMLTELKTILFTHNFFELMLQPYSILSLRKRTRSDFPWVRLLLMLFTQVKEIFLLIFFV